ncbi:MAG: rod shape-determining protein MreC [Erysipelotrichaceae bacterium]|nr:rod shape-determining protein MreC [Erysipelotrichaceae bacterium]
MFNNNNKSNKQRRRIIIITIVLVLFSVFTLITNRSPSTFETMCKDVVANIEYYVIKAPIQYVTNLLDEYTSLKDVFEENAELKERFDDLAREAAMNEVLQSELDDLKELTEIDYLPTDYQVKYTYIISRDADNWNSEVTINLGSLGGVETGMAVISSDGMIGTVTSVNDISATVTLLSSESSSTQLPVMILSGDDTYYGLLNRYDLTTQSYYVTLLSDVETIEDGAKVVTSGLGGAGKSPKGILVGTVDSYSAGNETTESSCNVTPSADFDSLNYVAVVQRVNEE